MPVWQTMRGSHWLLNSNAGPSIRKKFDSCTTYASRVQRLLISIGNYGALNISHLLCFLRIYVWASTQFEQISHVVFCWIILKIRTCHSYCRQEGKGSQKLADNLWLLESGWIGKCVDNADLSGRQLQQADWDCTRTTAWDTRYWWAQFFGHSQSFSQNFYLCGPVRGPLGNAVQKNRWWMPKLHTELGNKQADLNPPCLSSLWFDLMWVGVKFSRKAIHYKQESLR